MYKIYGKKRVWLNQVRLKQNYGQNSIIYKKRCQRYLPRGDDEKPGYLSLWSGSFQCWELKLRNGVVYSVWLQNVAPFMDEIHGHGLIFTALHLNELCHRGIFGLLTDCWLTSLQLSFRCMAMLCVLICFVLTCI